MSDQQKAATLPKWPFYLADAVLSGIAVFVLWQLGTFEGTAEMTLVGACLAAAAFGAWISVTPWLREFRGRVTITESSELNAALGQIQNLEKVAELIRASNAQWQGVHDAATRTVNSANEITARIKTEAGEFMKFLESAHDQERAAMRLEVDKLRRMEGDWLKVTVQILDHVFALNQAASRSGQASLVSQLQQFQNAVRDVARRMGLTPFVPSLGEPFDPRGHQLTDANFTPPEGSKVGEVLATGFTYQGQLLRRSLVLLAGDGPEAAAGPQQPSTTPLSMPVPGAVEQTQTPPEQPAGDDSPTNLGPSEPPQSNEVAESPRQLPPADPEEPFSSPAIVNSGGADEAEAVPMFADLADAEPPKSKRRSRDNAQLPLI